MRRTLHTLLTLTFLSTLGSHTSQAENFLQKLRQSHQNGPEKPQVQSVEPGSHPTETSQTLKVTTILNGLKQLAKSPKFNPKEGFDELLIQEAKLRKDLRGIQNAWIRESHQPPEEKSLAAETVLHNESLVLRQKLRELQKKIKTQIDKVMAQMGYEPYAEGSTNYKKGKEMLSVRFYEGEIKVNPLE